MRKVNERDVEPREYDQGESGFSRLEIGNAVGGGEIGVSLYEIPPGKRSWPYHYHTANEEVLYVLEGTATLRHDDGESDLEEGDYVRLPADESGGHQVVNTGDGVVRYLAASTMNEPDVTVYPEMDKIGVFVGAAPGGRDERSVHGYYRVDDDVEYWEDGDAEG
ncbi:MAG: cupin domain-containing protein [Halobacteriales archaeon]